MFKLSVPVGPVIFLPKHRLVDRDRRVTVVSGVKNLCPMPLWRTETVQSSVGNWERKKERRNLKERRTTCGYLVVELGMVIKERETSLGLSLLPRSDVRARVLTTEWKACICIHVWIIKRTVYVYADWLFDSTNWDGRDGLRPSLYCFMIWVFCHY